MPPMDIGSGAVAAVIALVGGVITKVLAVYYKKMELEFAESMRLRTDLALRCKALEDEIRLLREQSDAWHDKYYVETAKLKSEIASLKIESTAFSIQLRDIKNRNWIPEQDKDRYT